MDQQFIHAVAGISIEASRAINTIKVISEMFEKLSQDMGGKDKTMSQIAHYFKMAHMNAERAITLMQKDLDGGTNA